jgi:acyl dehydratase
MSDYRVIARNYVADSENRIHSDEIARRFGFRGALVAGVAVYGHLTYPLVQAFGEHWLGNSVSTVRFQKPAYDGDPLTIAMAPADPGYLVTCHDTAGTLLADMTSTMPAAMPAPMQLDCLNAPPRSPDRVEINWNNVCPEQPFTPWHWQITEDRNQTFARQVADDLAIYREAAHPHWLLAIANHALVREYVMPAWIHVGSEIRMHRLLKVNETVEVQAVPLEKWERKGHEFIRLYLRYTRDDEITTEIFHTAIFKVAG